MRIKLKGTTFDVEEIDNSQYIIHAVTTDVKGKEKRTKHLNYATIKQVKQYLIKYSKCGVEEVCKALEEVE